MIEYAIIEFPDIYNVKHNIGFEPGKKGRLLLYFRILELK